MRRKKCVEIDLEILALKSKNKLSYRTALIFLVINSFDDILDIHHFLSDECLSEGDKHDKWTKAED